MLDELGIDRCVLVGISLGARCAIQTALEHPERVAGLVLEGPGVPGMTFDDEGLAHARRARDEAAAELDADKWVENFLVEVVDGPSRHPEHSDAFRRAVEGLLARVPGW